MVKKVQRLRRYSGSERSLAERPRGTESCEKRAGADNSAWSRRYAKIIK